MVGTGTDSPGGASLAALLRTWRRRALLTQEQLAQRAGLSTRTIRRLEADGLRLPHIETIRMLASGLNLTDAERTLLLTAASGESHRSPLSVLRQLPADIAGFTGRVEQLLALDALLTDSDPATAVVISAIGGTAGIGKTTLAIHWAHRRAHLFPDGQLYINLRGFDPGGVPVEPATAVRGFLDALAVPAQQMPANPDSQAGLFRSLVAERRMLIVLDNARSAEQVRPLLPGAPNCLVLVTSRNELAGLIAAEGARPLVLNVMSAQEARELLARRLGQDRVGAEPHAVDEIIDLCARLPLALAVAAARISSRHDLALATLARELRRARLDALDTRDSATDVRSVFSWSYTMLSSPAARLFRLLGLHPGPDISTAAMASLAGTPMAHLPPLIAELTSANLVLEHIPGRYNVHDLLRAYATEQARTTDFDSQRQEATQRVLDHYLHTAHGADQLLNPSRTPITLTPPAPATALEHLTDYEHAMTWLDAEHKVLVTAIDHAAATGWDTHTWQLAWTLATFQHRRGHWYDRAAVQRAAVAAADRLADSATQARAHHNLAGAYISLGRDDDVDTHLQQSLRLATSAGDDALQADTHNLLAYLRGQQNRHAEAIPHAQQALALHQASGHRSGQANALHILGWHHAELGNHQQALTFCEQALAIHQELDNLDGQANSWDTIAQAHHHLGQSEQAITCYEHALHLVRALRNRYYEATTLTRLGDIHHTIGAHNDAHTCWHQALARS